MTPIISVRCLSATRMTIRFQQPTSLSIIMDTNNQTYSTYVQQPTRTSKQNGFFQRRFCAFGIYKKGGINTVLPGVGTTLEKKKLLFYNNNKKQQQNKATGTGNYRGTNLQIRYILHVSDNKQHFFQRNKNLKQEHIFCLFSLFRLTYFIHKMTNFFSCVLIRGVSQSNYRIVTCKIPTCTDRRKQCAMMP